MGCGVSTSAAAANAEPKPQDDAGHKSKNKARDAQLKKINSQLGGKQIVNSFVVQKTRSRKRDSETGTDGGTSVRKNAVEREVLAALNEEPLNADAGFRLPAEAAAVAEPGLQGISTSGPSFKMARGSQAKLLAEMNKLAQVDIFKPKLYSESDSEIMEGVTYFREQLSVVNPPVPQIRASGIVPRLITLLKRDDNRRLQYEVAWTLTNICSAEHDDCQDVCDQGGIPEFVRLLGACDDVEVLEQAIWALGNIAADSKELQKYVLEEEVVAPLLATMRRHANKPSLLRHAAWLLSNLCRPHPQSDDLFQAIPVLCSVILDHFGEAEAVTHSCWALAYLTGEEQGLEELLDAAEPGTSDRASTTESGNVLAKLVEWVKDATQTMTTPALRVLGNLCSGASAHTQAVVDAGGVPAMLSCLTLCGRLSIKKEVIWSLSNVAAGSSAQVGALLEAGVFPLVAELMRSAEDSLRRECAYVLANPWAATVAITHEVADGLIKEGVVRELCALLEVSTPAAILQVVMDGLQDAIKRGQQMMMAAAKARPPVAEGEEHPPPPPNPVAEAMKEFGALDKLQGLLKHDDEAIHAKANGMKNILQFL
mmetsp:Transcript_30665/g.78324  ORF Transcript_30665/g.78324 Transcript_30665/m.78324 type:complete len:596 (-) Transcript_30665:465-2252(-)